MKTVVLGPRPAELQSLIERRHALGIDLFDEVWEGSYHVAPAANAAHGYVDDVLALLLIWRRASDTGYQEAPVSELLDVTAADLAASIDWPEESD